MNSAPKTRHPVTAQPAATRMLRTTDLLILSIGTFTLGVDGFVLSGLLPQVAASLHVWPAPPASSPPCSPWSTP